jgi:hypothetical protein
MVRRLGGKVIAPEQTGRRKPQLLGAALATYRAGELVFEVGIRQSGLAGVLFA